MDPETQKNLPRKKKPAQETNDVLPTLGRMAGLVPALGAMGLGGLGVGAGAGLFAAHRALGYNPQFREQVHAFTDPVTGSGGQEPASGIPFAVDASRVGQALRVPAYRGTSGRDLITKALGLLRREDSPIQGPLATALGNKLQHYENLSHSPPAVLPEIGESLPVGAGLLEAAETKVRRSSGPLAPPITEEQLTNRQDPSYDHGRPLEPGVLERGTQRVRDTLKEFQKSLPFYARPGLELGINQVQKPKITSQTKSLEDLTDLVARPGELMEKARGYAPWLAGGGAALGLGGLAGLYWLLRRPRPLTAQEKRQRKEAADGKPPGKPKKKPGLSLAPLLGAGGIGLGLGSAAAGAVGLARPDSLRYRPEAQEALDQLVSRVDAAPDLGGALTEYMDAGGAALRAPALGDRSTLDMIQTLRTPGTLWHTIAKHLPTFGGEEGQWPKNKDIRDHYLATAKGPAAGLQQIVQHELPADRVEPILATLAGHYLTSRSLGHLSGGQASGPGQAPKSFVDPQVSWRKLLPGLHQVTEFLANNNPDPARGEEPRALTGSHGIRPVQVPQAVQTLSKFYSGLSERLAGRSPSSLTVEDVTKAVVPPGQNITQAFSRMTDDQSQKQFGVAHAADLPKDQQKTLINDLLSNTPLGQTISLAYHQGGAGSAGSARAYRLLGRVASLPFAAVEKAREHAPWLIGGGLGLAGLGAYGLWRWRQKAKRKAQVTSSGEESAAKEASALKTLWQRLSQPPLGVALEPGEGHARVLSGHSRPWSGPQPSETLGGDRRYIVRSEGTLLAKDNDVALRGQLASPQDAPDLTEKLRRLGTDRLDAPVNVHFGGHGYLSGAMQFGFDSPKEDRAHIEQYGQALGQAVPPGSCLMPGSCHVAHDPGNPGAPSLAQALAQASGRRVVGSRELTHYENTNRTRSDGMGAEGYQIEVDPAASTVSGVSDPILGGQAVRSLRHEPLDDYLQSRKTPDQTSQKIHRVLDMALAAAPAVSALGSLGSFGLAAGNQNHAGKLALLSSLLAAPNALAALGSYGSAAHLEHQMHGGGVTPFLQALGRAAPNLALPALPLLAYGAGRLMARKPKKAPPGEKP